jgi:hypothetical protein
MSEANNEAKRLGDHKRTFILQPRTGLNDHLRMTCSKEQGISLLKTGFACLPDFDNASP